MAVLTTQYSVGDTVWNASTTTEMKSHPCPDCLGSRRWLCESPAGGKFEVECPRCGAGYKANSALSLTFAQHVPLARAMTIGLVKASTATGDAYDAGNSYMCHETGIGSGSVYRERDLFATEAEAMAAAQIRADLANADKDGWVAKQFDATAKFADYQLKDAEIEAAKSASSRALYDVGYLLEDLENADSLGDVKDTIAAWREKKAAA